jgi:hypothetical protein
MGRPKACLTHRFEPKSMAHRFLCQDCDEMHALLYICEAMFNACPQEWKLASIIALGLRGFCYGGMLTRQRSGSSAMK